MSVHGFDMPSNNKSGSKAKDGGLHNNGTICIDTTRDEPMVSISVSDLRKLIGDAIHQTTQNAISNFKSMITEMSSDIAVRFDDLSSRFDEFESIMNSTVSKLDETSVKVNSVCLNKATNSMADASKSNAHDVNASFTTKNFQNLLDEQKAREAKKKTLLCLIFLSVVMEIKKKDMNLTCLSSESCVTRSKLTKTLCQNRSEDLVDLLLTFPDHLLLNVKMLRIVSRFYGQLGILKTCQRLTI